MIKIGSLQRSNFNSQINNIQQTSSNSMGVKFFDPNLTAKMVFLWGAILYIIASFVYLIEVKRQTEYISSLGFVFGSGLFAISDLIRIPFSEGFGRAISCSFCFGGVLLTIASIFFIPGVGHAEVGNYIYATGGGVIFINHMILWYKLYQCHEGSWQWPAFARLINHIGGCMFTVGNGMLIYDYSSHINISFTFFTFGSLCFIVGGSFAFFNPVDPPKDQKVQSPQKVVSSETIQNPQIVS